MRPLEPDIENRPDFIELKECYFSLRELGADFKAKQEERLAGGDLEGATYAIQEFSELIAKLEALGSEPKITLSTGDKLCLSDALVLSKLGKATELGWFGATTCIASSKGRITELNLSHADVSEVPLESLVELKALILQSGDEVDISSLTNCPSISSLTIRAPKIKGFDVIAEMAGLRELNINDIQLKQEHYEIISQAERLKKLSLISQKRPKLDAISTIPDLEELQLSFCGRCSLAPLSGSPKLAKLDICSTGVRDFAALREMKALKDLFIDERAFNKRGNQAVLNELRARGVTVRYRK